MLSQCASLSALELGKEIHWDVISCGFMSDVCAGDSLVDVYAKCGNREFARDLFDKKPQWDAVSWDTLIGDYLHTGFVGEALKVSEKMPERDVLSWNKMMAGYAHNRCFDEPPRLFRMIPKWNWVFWNCMLAGNPQNGLVEEAVELLKMPNEIWFRRIRRLLDMHRMRIARKRWSSFNRWNWRL